MKTVLDIIGLWPNAEQFARDIGVKYPSYGRVMKLRRRIPRVHWPALVEASQKIGKPVSREEIEAAHLATPSEERGAAA
jgi:hypothetical protein